MGNLLFCSGKNENEINLSESCIQRLLREEKESDRKSPAAELNIPENLSEKEKMMKLKCLDDAHSNEYGLTIQGFYKLIDTVESKLEPIRNNLCDPEDVVKCLKKNHCCTIRCKPVIDKYIDCIETFRINIIKEQVECEQKEKRKQEQEIIEDFLKAGNL